MVRDGRMMIGLAKVLPSLTALNHLDLRDSVFLSFEEGSSPEERFSSFSTDHVKAGCAAMAEGLVS